MNIMKVIINDKIHSERELVKCFEKAMRFPVPAENFDDLNELLMHPTWLHDENLEIEIVHESVPGLSEEDLCRYISVLWDCLDDWDRPLPGEPKSIKATFSNDFKPFFKRRVPQMYRLMLKAQMSTKADWRQIVLIFPMYLILLFALVGCIMLVDEVATTWAYLCAAAIGLAAILAECFLMRLFIKYIPVLKYISMTRNIRVE